MTVIAIVETDKGTAVGTASSSGATAAIDLVRRAEANAATAPPAEDASPLSPPSKFASGERLRRPTGHDEPGRAR